MAGAADRVSELYKSLTTSLKQGREYYQLPTSGSWEVDRDGFQLEGPGGYAGGGGFVVSSSRTWAWALLNRRVAYYWIALGSQCLQFLFQIALFHKSTYFAAATRFVLVTGQFVLWLACWSVLCLKKYNSESSASDYHEIRRNAIVHIVFSVLSALCCLLTICFMFIVCASQNPDGSTFLRPLIFSLLVISAGASCFASRMTYRSLAHARIHGSVTLPNTASAS